MTWYHRLWLWLWPFGRAKRERHRQITEEFQAELAKAKKRRGDLDDIVQQLRDQKPERVSKPPRQTALQGNGTP